MPALVTILDSCVIRSLSMRLTGLSTKSTDSVAFLVDKVPMNKCQFDGFDGSFENDESGQISIGV